jgi:hypothetical protein
MQVITYPESILKAIHHHNLLSFARTPANNINYWLLEKKNRLALSIFIADPSRLPSLNPTDRDVAIAIRDFLYAFAALAEQNLKFYQEAEKSLGIQPICETTDDVIAEFLENQVVHTEVFLLDEQGTPFALDPNYYVNIEARLQMCFMPKWKGIDPYSQFVISSFEAATENEKARKLFESFRDAIVKLDEKITALQASDTETEAATTEPNAPVAATPS